AVADRLIAVHLREIRLIHGAGADLLCVDSCRGSEFGFDAEAPFHEVGRVKFATRYGGDSDRRKTSRRNRLRRRTGKLSLRKSLAEGVVRGESCVNRAVRNSRRNLGAADSAEESALESFDVGWIDTDHVRNAAGQNVAEDSKAGAQDGLGLELPRDRGAG